ncbi:MAG: hypothetical protein KAG34_05570 [Cocleimonas sp.]|nr:hypothetical protein [Cocleimonas sp.]
MNNNSQNDGILPPKAPNTRQSGEYSPDFYQKIFKAVEPHHRSSDGVDIALNDSRALVLNSVMGQVELLQDLGNKISGNEDIAGFGLVGFADGLIRQLRVLDVVQGEYYHQVGQQKDQQQKIISERERARHEDATKIAELERTIIKMKGGVL